MSTNIDASTAPLTGKFSVATEGFAIGALQMEVLGAKPESTSAFKAWTSSSNAAQTTNVVRPLEARPLSALTLQIKSAYESFNPDIR